MDVRLEGEGHDGLEHGDQHERPCPLCIWDIHSGCATSLGRELSGEAFAVVVAPGLGVELGRRLLEGRRVLEGWLVVLVGVVVLIEWLTSQEGCAGLVVRNFGRMSSREGRLKREDIEWRDDGRGRDCWWCSPTTGGESEGT